VKYIHAYIICATPRSGSTLLCDLLTDTGVAGCPDSFFRRESFPWWADYFGVSAKGWRNDFEFDHSYLSAVKQYGTNATPLFGMRLMWESVAGLSQRLESFYPGLPCDNARLEAAFGAPLYLHLSRKGKVAQAVSRLRAEQSGLWHVSTDGSERERLKPGREPVYDGRVLAELVGTLEEHDANWVNWFAQQQIAPLCITYEVLSSAPKAVLATVLSALGQDSALADTVKPRTAKLADSQSDDWATRFRKGHPEHDSSS
jgi:LPS sulfotransferase NodH